MKRNLQRALACATVAGVLAAGLPQVAFAADGNSGGKGVVDTVKGWFSDDDDDKGDSHPSPGGKLEIPSREKLPKGKAEPEAKRVRELTGRRTPTARFFELSDGRVEAELSAVPTVYRSGSRWKPIDPGIRPEEAKGFALANTTNLGRSYFGDSAGRLARFEGPGGAGVTFGLKDAGHLTPQVKGNTVTYKDALPQTDLEYVVGRGQVKENLVINAAPKGPVSYTFTLDLNKGLIPEQRKDGSIAVFGEHPTEPVMVIPAPYLTDAAKDRLSPTGGTYSTKITQKLAKAPGGGWTLTVTPDAKWLASPERVYPVTADPTVTIVPSAAESQDVMVMSDQPTTNFNSTWQLSVGKTNTGLSRSLLKFPLDSIPAGTKIDSARMSVYFDQSHTSNGQNVVIGAHRATGAWNETDANWSKTSSFVGELSGTSVMLDDGDPGTAAVGEWPRVGTIGAVNIGNDFAANKNTATGESYTFQPTVPEKASYQVDAHVGPLADATSAAPYTLNHSTEDSTPQTTQVTVDQTTSGAPAWKPVSNGQLFFEKGTAGKIVVGDTGSSTKRTIADAIRLVNPSTIVKNIGEYSQWHDFPVGDTVQKWLDGSAANYGFVIKAEDESADGALGGPLYEAGDGNYGGEISTVPRLTVVYGKAGSSLASPTTVHSTGPELSWNKYSNTTGNTGDNFVEYQLHRSYSRTFTPGPGTLVTPIAGQSTSSYTDTTATPSAPSADEQISRVYYYMIAVKTKNGALLPSPTRAVGIPQAGRTMKLIQGDPDRNHAGVTDTTLSSLQPTANHDTLESAGIMQKWISVGNNSGLYGVTRAALKFPTTGIPTTATVVDAELDMWAAQTTSETAGAVYELHPMTRDFAETAATWNKADATTSWTTPGGDISATVSDTVPQITTDLGRHYWGATKMVQDWVKTPSSNKGAMIKLKNETSSGPQERTVFLSSEAFDWQLGPLMRVIYVDATAEDTYYAPATPQRMTPNSTYTVKTTVTNTTNTTWNASAVERVLSYRWTLPDGSTPPGGGTALQTNLPLNIPPGSSATVNAQVNTPTNSDEGNKRTDWVLTWDVYNKTTSTWLSDTAGGAPGLTQNVAVEDPTSNQIGLEKFYAYAGKNTGAGSTVMNNLAAGNSVWSYNAFTNPGRGLNTFFRLAYNSLDTSDTVSGGGWSMQASGPVRLGAPLDFHPNPNPTEVRLPDGDGTTHVFRKQGDGTWKAPAGVHYRLTAKAGLDCTPDKDPVPDAWTMTRPDGTRFLFGCDGYMTQTIDKNGNTMSFSYEERKSNNKPTKFLRYITDPADRTTLTVDYWEKGQDGYQYINDAGDLVTDNGKLTNSKIYDHLRSVTDISGRKIEFYYTTQGLLGQFTDGVGSTDGAPKVFRFTYDATQGNKNVKLVTATDPRGNPTRLTYNEPNDKDNPKYHWWTKTINDRLGHDTTFAYKPDETNDEFTDTTVTDAQAHATNYVLDDFGRQRQVTNAKAETTTLNWDTDNNVTYLEEANHAKSTFCYDSKTGYPLRQWSAEQTDDWDSQWLVATFYCNPANDTSLPGAAKYEYRTRLDGYAADLVRKTSPQGRTSTFGYDCYGNLKTVTDPRGTATWPTDPSVCAPTTSGPTVKYDYDAYGQLTKATDARGNASQNTGFDANGYPQTITDPYGEPTKFVYDERGQVESVIDANEKETSQTYDTFGRPKVSTVPKVQDDGEFITTPAPEYDANDNVTKATAPTGAVSRAQYDAADQVSWAIGPDNNNTGRKTVYTYDTVGNLLTTTEPKGAATTGDLTDYVTTNHYDDIYQLTSVVNAEGDTVSYTYDEVGNLTKVVDPKKNATPDTDDYTTLTEYDRNHRAWKVTDAAGKSATTVYDLDSVVKSTTDQEGNTTEIVPDPRGVPAEVKTPYEGSTIRTTKFEYDAAGNRTKVITPRGVNTPGVADDFVARTEYDKLNRPVKQFQPYDPADSRYNRDDVYTETVYDKVGRVTKVSLPPSEGQTVRNDTDYTYYDNGWTYTSTDPWDIRTQYDYTDLGQQQSRTLTSAGGDSTRTMGWSYYPDGSLQARSDTGVPVGKDVVVTDNSDTQTTTATGTWSTATAAGQQGHDHRAHTAGTGTDTFTWNLNTPADGTYTVYAKFPEVTGAATTAKYTITHDGTATDKTVDQTQNTGTWVSLGSYPLKQGNTDTIRLAQNATGIVVADAVKLVRTPTETDNEHKDAAYTYDLNGNLTQLTDTSSTAKIDTYRMSYTGLNQLNKLEELLAGTVKKTTEFGYDANGLPETVSHPQQYSEYTYDLRDLVKTVKVGESAADDDPETTSYTYTDRGQRLHEIKANDNTVDYTYYLNGALKTQKEEKPGGVLVSSHTYAYDANGNKAQDVASKMNADIHTEYLTSTTNYTYDPADRLKQAVKTGNGAGTETYIHDNNANVTTQTIKNVTTTFTYDRNRLLSATSAGTSASYNYDAYGRLDTVASGGKILEDSDYDGYDHIIKHTKLQDDGTTKTSTYTFDPLDRTASKTESGKTTDYNYLGISSEVLSEVVAGEVAKSFQYSPWGERLSQLKHKSDDTEELGVYGYNSHTDTETLTDENGNSKATYGYTAYGKNDNAEFTGIDKPEADNPSKEAYNPYRFNSKRWDAASGTYDMGFRDYNPGLNRFTTRDAYSGALADMNLGADPYTGNRYAFAGGNPASFVELDGHRIAEEPDGSRYSPLDFTSLHDLVVANTVPLIEAQMKLEGITGTITVSRLDNVIPYSGKKGEPMGYADIILTGTGANKNEVWIWEIKSRGGQTEWNEKGNMESHWTQAPKQLQRYIDKLQDEYNHYAPDVTVKPGFGLPSSKLQSPRGNPVSAWSGNENTHPGIRWYAEDKKKEKEKEKTEGDGTSVGEVVVAAGLTVGAIGIGVGTVAEDVATGGVGVLDDPASFALSGTMLSGAWGLVA
ncbi:hypothetical protein SRB5_53560 [Streptomyces sp. RB5]|uniref:Golvesin/Xly CBD-like domain-containing protein n=2 Tax=Streptomyces smaragdinus TaxID=2585196 RepID=A0A7K0CNX9_9ACTN|nr:hypothetical protein [Streptomyces smaragdinus]